MNEAIEAIFLDVGNTLRILLKEDLPHRAAARARIAELVGTDADPLAFCSELDRRYKDYRKWAFQELTEAPETELWTHWLAPEFPPERIEPLAHELTYQFRQSMGRRVTAEDGKHVVEVLHQRGYTLGIISNVITTQEVPDWLRNEGLEPFFKSVVLSSQFGRRKPHPSLYIEAARRANVPPARCAYVGDNFSRDVEGTRAAGFGMVIILPDPADRDAPQPEEYQPDRVIHSLTELLDVFPGPMNGKGS